MATDLKKDLQIVRLTVMHLWLGGYIKNVANGIYSQFPPMKRISQKIEAIIRDEMDKIDGQEVLFLLHYRVVFGKNQEDMKV